MSDFANPSLLRVARKEHRCIWCAHPIAVGEKYSYQTGNYDGRWYANHTHLECFETICAEREGEFMPYSGEPPERLRTHP